MKNRSLIALCIFLIVLLANTPAQAQIDSGTAIAVDTLVVRPVSLAVTAIGCAVFLLALPFAAASDTVDETAQALVVKPAAATFVRRLGDFDAL